VHTEFSLGNLRERNHFETQAQVGGQYSIEFSRNSMKVSTWMISFMIGASGALNKHDNEPLGSIKLGGGNFLTIWESVIFSRRTLSSDCNWCNCSRNGPARIVLRQ